MGSKSKIMDFVLDGINEVYQGGGVCDLFSGSASLAGALGQQCAVHSNDIQTYSSILADTYNKAYLDDTLPTAEELIGKAESIFIKNKKSINIKVKYYSLMSLEEFNQYEDLQKDLINRKFKREWHLFVKNYSGTWWSTEQCLWIDALREVAESYKNKPYYPAILSSLMFAMAYASQGTGHFAQYRDAKTQSSLKDILIYRKRSLLSYFKRKYEEVTSFLPREKPNLNHKSTALGYMDCLENVRGGVIYADPPYCFVHYSRFYHALETLVLYDYPNIQIKNNKIVKGRYRENRHQSPFCIKSQVNNAFKEMFSQVEKNKSKLVLSYSTNGMISIDEVEQLAVDAFRNRSIELLTTDHQHMTLGRQKDRHRNVKECLLLVK